MKVGGVSVVQLVRILRAKLNLALNQLRPARWDIRSILAADPNSPQVPPLSQTHLHYDANHGWLTECIWSCMKDWLANRLICLFLHPPVYSCMYIHPGLCPCLHPFVSSISHSCNPVYP